MISIIVPCFNEAEALPYFYEEICRILRGMDEYELIFVDDGSTDDTLPLIRGYAECNENVIYLSFSRNFGKEAAMYAGFCNVRGEYAAVIDADMQDPPEVIPQFVAKWEEGYKVVTGIKSQSRENPLMYTVRGIYYKILSKISETEHIQQFDGFGLYDASFVKLLRKMKDPLPYLRGLVAEYGCRRTEVQYTQEKRKAGKTSFNFARYYDVAMLGLTSSTKAIMRMATFLGVIMAGICILIAIITVIMKLVNWSYFDVGTAAIIAGIFFVGAVQIFFLGFLGEYILNINIRVMQHPIVVEERRINLRRSCDDQE